MRTLLLTQLLLTCSADVRISVIIWIVHTLFVCVSVRFTDVCLRVPYNFLLPGYQDNFPEDEVAMGTNSFFHIWRRQSVPVLVVYPPFDFPQILASRDTRHHRTQFHREPCQVVKQNLSLFIHDILHGLWNEGHVFVFPDSSKARRTVMNPSDSTRILRIGLFLVLCHPSPMKESSMSL